MQVKITGMDALVSGLQSRANTNQIKQIVRECGTDLKSKTLTNMAGAYTHGYSTGRTARTTSLDFSDGGLTAKVKPTTEYFPFLEYGTRYMAAMPTLKPAFDVEAPLFIQKLRRVMK